MDETARVGDRVKVRGSRDTLLVEAINTSKDKAECSGRRIWPRDYLVFRAGWSYHYRGWIPLELLRVHSADLEFRRLCGE